MEKNYLIDFRTVGARIREARRMLGLTQEEAAELSFISGQFLSLVETGKKRASVDTYRQLAAVLGLTLDDLFYDDIITVRVLKSYSRDELLADCNNNEQTILCEALIALKIILKQNRGMPSGESGSTKK